MSLVRPSIAWLVAATGVAVLAAGCNVGGSAPDDAPTATRDLSDTVATTDVTTRTHDQQAVTTDEPDEDPAVSTGPDTDTATATAGPTSTAADTDTAERTGDAAEETATPTGDLAAGTHHGYLSGLTSGTVEGQRVSIVGFDEVDFLTGEEATDAARDAGVIGPEEESVPNDYFIRNEDPLVRQVPVIPDSQVYLLDGGSPDLVPGSIVEAVASEGLFEVDVVVVRGVSLITAVQAVYLP